MTSIEIQNLTKRFGDKTVVDHLNLDIREGELLALLGVNGAGKTTTIRMLTGLLPPDEGEARLLGKSILREAAEAKQFLAVSPQESAVASKLTVEENLAFIAGGKENDMKRFWIYILISFGLGWLLQGLGMLLGGFAYTLCLALCMFTPLVATWVVSGGLKKERSGVSWWSGIAGKSVGWWLLAWFAPALLCLAGALLFFLLFPQRFDPTLSLLSSTIPPETALPARFLLLVSAVQALSYAPFINMVAAVGEEAGWRGWLTPFLAERWGRRKALLLSGLIWGLWHAPVIALAGYNFGVGYWGFPVTGILVMCLGCWAMGTLLSFLYARCGSIWAPALAHGALNAVAALGVYLLSPDAASSYLLGPTPLGLVAGLPLFALALWLFLKGPAKE